MSQRVFSASHQRYCDLVDGHIQNW